MRRNGMKAVLIMGAILLAFLIPLASAEIFLGQLKPLYNWGDDFQINATLAPRASVNDFFIAKIACPEGETEIYKSTYNLKAGQQKQITITAKLDRFLIGSFTGECTLKASYSGDKEESQKFELSNKANVNIDLIGSVFNPGSKIPASGKVQKVNGKNLEGFVETTIQELNISITSLVQNGKFQVNLTIPENAPSRNYQLEAYAYEKDGSGMITNEGKASLLFQVPQIIKKVEAAYEKLNIIPGEDAVYIIILTDQAGEDAKQYTDFQIIDSKGKQFFQNRIKSGEINSLTIPKNASPGSWKSIVIYSGLKEEKALNVEVKEEVSFNLENQTLTISNVGNIPYTKSLNIDIGGSKIIREIYLEVGETKKLKLLAPDGEYPIRLSDGGEYRNLGEAYLTGDAVNIRDLSKLQLGGISKIVLWIALIIILAGIAYFAYKRVEKKRYLGKMPSADSEPAQTLRQAAPLIHKEHGKKEETAVIALKIKNLPEHLASESKALSAISSALEAARDRKARIYEQGEFKVIILSPSITGEKETEMAAVKIANEMKEIFDEHNKKHALKIEYGLGINSGEMILEVISGKAKFTSIGNTTISAKKTAETSKNDILMTRQAHRKTSTKVKAESIKNGELWRVKHIINRDKHNAFIQKFMSKQKND